MSNRFIKFIPSEKADWLRSKYPFAFLLLNLIAQRARITPGDPSGLEIGEAHIGDYEAIGATRRQYRTALQVLIDHKIIKKIETCRNRKKSTTGTTTVGTKVKVISSNIYDLNLKLDDHRNDHRATTERPPSDHEQEREEREERKEKEEEKNTTTTIPCSSEKVSSSSFFYSCLKEVDIEESYKIDLTEQFPETKVAEAVAYVLDERYIMKTSMQHTLFWFCRSKKRIIHAEKPQAEWKVLASKHNKIYEKYTKAAFIKNQDLIKNQKMMIWQIDSFTMISLANDMKVLKEDFQRAEKEYQVSIKNWRSQEKIEKLQNYA